MRIKKILATLAVAVASSANATDFATQFSVGSLQVGTTTYISLDLDLVVGQRFLPANGSFNGANGLSAPATGTCFPTSAGGIFCNLQVDQSSYTLDIGATLSGIVTVKNADGLEIGSATVDFLGLEE